MCLSWSQGGDIELIATEGDGNMRVWLECRLHPHSCLPASKSADSKEVDSYIHYIDSAVPVQTIHAARQAWRRVLTRCQANAI